MPGYEMSIWWGVLAPPGMPPAVVDKLYKEIAALLGQPESAQRLAAEGAEPSTMPSAAFERQLIMSINILGLLEGLSLGVAGGVQPDLLKQIIRDGIANSKVLGLWEAMGPRWKSMLEAAPPGAELPNMRKDLHTALELARELGVNLPVGTQASLIADAGVATGNDNPLALVGLQAYEHGVMRYDVRIKMTSSPRRRGSSK